MIMECVSKSLVFRWVAFTPQLGFLFIDIVGVPYTAERDCHGSGFDRSA